MKQKVMIKAGSAVLAIVLLPAVLLAAVVLDVIALALGVCAIPVRPVLRIRKRI